MSIDASTDVFPVTWGDPADAELTWFRDAMHFPAPATPLTASFLRESLEPGVAAACATLVSPLRTLRHTVVQRLGLQQPRARGRPPGHGGARSARTCR